MVKGRRTRQAATVGQVLAAATATTTDDTASPKRKDFKFDNNSPSQHFTNNNNNSQLLTNGRKPAVEAMVLRGGRTKLNGIDRYFTSSGKPSSPGPTEQNVIDLTDDNTSESIAESPLMVLGFAAAAVANSNPASNIFLQEPVLSLNIDKSCPAVGQSSRVIIKNSFFGTEMQTQFSPPKCDPVWGGGGGGVDVLKREPLDFALDLSKPTQVTEIDSTTFHDSSSCDSGDSGVVILPAITNIAAGGPLQFEPSTPGEGKRRKPATPHRIVCPSPVKSSSIVASPSSALSHLNIQSKRQPRKNVKSKRRLHTKELENALEEAATSVPTNNSSVPEASPMLETGAVVGGAATATAAATLTGMLPPAATVKPATLLQKQKQKKPVLNTAANPTALQNTNNNNQSRANSAAAAVAANKKVTDYFQVRRSVRKTKKEVQWERDRDLERAIYEQRESGLTIVEFEGKGRGIVTTRKFARGEFVVEYIGDLIDMAEAKLREQEYAEDDSTGCYMYYFKHQNVQHCIDATAESGKLGRLVNHSRNGNLMTKTVLVNDLPHLVLLAKEDIPEGVEVTYDYGDRSKEALQHHPWLAF